MLARAAPWAGRSVLRGWLGGTSSGDNSAVWEKRLQEQALPGSFLGTELETGVPEPEVGGSLE
jgi:hypothetical protein